MPIIKKLNALKAEVVYGFAGMKVAFNENGLAEVSEKEAEFLLQVPGYELIEGCKDEENPFDLENDFNELSWQKQKVMIDKGQVPDGALPLIIEGDYTDAVKKSAKRQLKG